MAPLAGLLVVDLTRYLPGAVREPGAAAARRARRANRERRTAIRCASLAPAWDAALNAGKESVVCDLKAEPGARPRALSRARTSCSRASARASPTRLGVGPDDAARGRRLLLDHRLRRRTGRHEHACGPRPQLPRATRACSPTRRRALPPVQIADLAAGALGAVARDPRRAARARANRPRPHLVVSMTHGAHDLVAHRVGGEPVPKLLTGGVACYRDLRDRRRPVSHRRRARAEVLPAALRAGRASRSSSSASGSRASPSSRSARRRSRSPSGSSSSTARTSPSGRWRRSRRRRPSSRRPAAGPRARARRAHGRLAEGARLP